MESVASTTKDKILRFLIKRGFRGNRIKIQKDTFINYNNVRLRNCKIIVSGKNAVIDFGVNNVLFDCEIRIFGDNCRLELREGNRMEKASLWQEDKVSSISIGSRNRFTGSIELAVIEGTALRIGDDNLFSRNIQISTGDSHSLIDLDKRKRINPSRDIILNNHIWVGMHATICKGVTIPDNVIVGRGSILTRPLLEGNVAVAGIPAHIVKKNVDWEFERLPLSH